MILTDLNYVDKAEDVIKKLKKKTDYRTKREKYMLTTSKIRNLLSLTSALYDEVQTRPFETLNDRLAYLRVQYVYQAGRENSVKDLVDKAEILEALKEVNDKESLIRFCRYMEALVAYFKFYGGEEG